jgi:trehalose 6-phosphate synthase/phosphatase
MRLLVISNRLPVTVEEHNGTFLLRESAGGLVSGISAYLSSLKSSPGDKSYYQWMGWPGRSISEKSQDSFKELAQGLNLRPVFLSEKVMDKFYLGFCNKTIWPLFHYFTVYTVFDEEYWSTYKNVNEIFCDEILKIVEPDDTIWIHDYHLMLLPKLLRNKLPKLKIGFFLHIPFPSYEIFRMLPKSWRQEILEGLLGADLIGFHTYDYTKYFLSCVLRILGFESNVGQISLPDRLVKAESFPMGIDYEGFQKAISTDEAKEERERIIEKFKDTKIVLSIDRLDYSKGILNRLKGYQLFLKKNPDWHNKVNLLMIVVPSRIGVDRYSQMKREIDEKVGFINGKYGNIHWTPIIYQYRFIPQNTLAGLYSTADAALITPLRDGMNLIAKEFVTCKIDLAGVLILSEMAGASKELGEALIINPNNTEEIALAIKEALEMPLEEQKRRNKIMQIRLRRYNVNRWAEYFIKSLDKVKEIQIQWDAKLLDKESRKCIINDFKSSEKAIFFLDYDGTLVRFESRPEYAVPSDTLLNILSDLSLRLNCNVVIISGRDKNTLDKWFNNSNLILAAEHGAWLKSKEKGWSQNKSFNTDWKKLIYPFLERYIDLLPGSFIEEKDFSLVWHYRRSDPEQSSVKAKELLDDLVNVTGNLDVQVIQGSKIIEIRNNGVNKGTLVSDIINRNRYDFIFAAGDDWTDEDMFRVLPDKSCTIKIGMSSTRARYNLQNHEELRKLILDFINV